MLQNPIRRSQPAAREGKVLVGCLIAIGVVVLLAIIATVLAVMNWSKMVAWSFDKGTGMIVSQLPIDQSERAEVMDELSVLIGQYRDKEISFEQLGDQLGAIARTPGVQAGLISSAASSYINASPLSDEEKAAGENELQRLALGILDGTINPQALEDILAPLDGGNGSSGDTITIGVHFASSGKEEYRILKPSAVTKEQITQVIESARAEADEAGVDGTPVAIDLSDEIKKTLAGAEPAEEP